MKIKNKVIKVVSSFLVFSFLGINTVFATWAANGESVKSGGNYADYSKAPAAVSAESIKNFVVGARISLVTSDGTTVSSKDYYIGGVAANSMSTKTCNKLDYASGRCPSVTDPNSWQRINSTSYASTLEQAFINQGVHISISGAISSGNMSRDNMFGSLFKGIPEERIKNAVNAMMRDAGVYNYTIDSFKLANDSYDLFIEWEPLSRLRITTEQGNNYYYYGTTYELSNLANSLEGFNIGNNSCNGSTGFCNFGNAVGKGLGCSVYLSSSNPMGNIVNENIDNSKKANFSQSSYFKGKLDLNTWNASSCNASTSAIKNQSLSYNTSSGVGVIWLSEFFDPDIPPYDEPGDGNNCTPFYNVPSCTSGTGNLVYQDSNDWEKCIFTDDNEGKLNRYDINPHKVSNKNSDLTYYDRNLSSSYCEVYCRESVNASFPFNNPTVLAGSSFEWGFYSVNVTRECKTKSIDWDRFNNELKAANEEVVQAMVQQALHDANNGVNWVAGGQCIAHPGTGKIITGQSFTCTNSVLNNQIQHHQGDCESIHNSGGYSGCTATLISKQKKGYYDEYTYEYSNCNKTETSGAVMGTEYRFSPSTYNITKTVGTITKKAATSDIMDCLTSAPSGNPIPTADVAAATRRVEAILSEMNKCHDFADGNVLNDASTAKIMYSSPNGTYYYEDNMNKTTTSRTVQTNECNSSKNVFALTDCNNNSCKNNDKSLKICSKDLKNDSYTKMINSISEFSIKAGVYQYVLKNPNGATVKSIHQSELGNYTSGKFTVNWLDVGYSNFPVPYRSVAQHYESALKIQYNNLGHASSATANTAVDRILSSTDADKFGTFTNWLCGYTVKPDLIGNPDLGDINLIYREIDLKNPFPDIDAKHRRTGANWCSGESCEWNNPISSKYILKNRNVTGDEIYNLEPMYTFIMTPSDIIKIRRYNNENTYTSYTGSFSGKNYDFKCISGTGLGCRSDYLDELMSLMDAKEHPGTCKNDRTVYPSQDLSKSISKFESCRY